MATFSEQLQAERRKRDLTQGQLAAAAGVPVGTLRDYEQGKRTPLFPNVLKLAKALGVDCTVFAECDDMTADPPPAKGKGAKPPTRKRR